MDEETPDGNDCHSQIIRARKQGFASGRRAGIWLAFNGPRAKAEARRIDARARRALDRDMEGLGDVFGRAEEGAEQKDRLRRIEPPSVRMNSSLSGLTPDREEGKYDEYAESVFGPPAPAPPVRASAPVVAPPAPAPAPPVPASAPVVAPPAPAPAPAPRPPASDVFAPPAPRPDEIPELPLDQYAPDGYNEFTTQELRDRLEALRQQEKNPEVKRLMEVIRKRRLQDIREMNRVIRSRQRQEEEARLDPRSLRARARVRERQEADRRERQEYEAERARLSDLPGGLARRDRLDRQWLQKQRDRIGF